jgi:hypothetical protein
LLTLKDAFALVGNTGGVFNLPKESTFHQSPDMVPDGMSCLGLEYFCLEGDGSWTAPDADLITAMVRQ